MWRRTGVPALAQPSCLYLCRWRRSVLQWSPSHNPPSRAETCSETNHMFPIVRKTIMCIKHKLHVHDNYTVTACDLRQVSLPKMALFFEHRKEIQHLPHGFLWKKISIASARIFTLSTWGCQYSSCTVFLGFVVMREKNVGLVRNSSPGGIPNSWDIVRWILFFTALERWNDKSNRGWVQSTRFVDESLPTLSILLCWSSQ